jgi:methionine sulfoxide reductase heme-binding subunit
MRNMFEAWKLTLLLVTGLLIMVAVAMLLAASPVEASRHIIRWTARCSLLLFLAAFTASSLVQLVPATITRWLSRNRRYLALAFAASHTIHLIGIVALASQDKVLFWQLTNYGTMMSGGLAYVFIFAMALTSFDRTAAMLGERLWRRMHSAGAWYIWISFVVTFGKRFAMDIAYLPAMIMIFLALLIRVVARLHRSRIQTALVSGS